MSGLFALVALVLSALAYNRIGRLEKIVEGLMRNGVTPSTGFGAAPLSSQSSVVPTPSGNVVPMPHAVASSNPYQSASVPTSPREPGILEQFFHWCSIDWPMKLGALLIFLAVGWIVTVVFWDIIGPIGQVSLGLVLGILILVFGAQRIVRSVHQGSVILALGAGTIYLTIFAARAEYDFFTPALALLFMFLVTVFVGFTSVVRKSFSLAMLGLFLGGIAPLLTNSGHTDILGLFSYLFVLMMGTLWVTRLTGWRNLTVAGIILYGLYTLPFMTGSYFGAVDPDQSLKVSIAMVFATLFFIANVLSIVYDRLAEKGDLIIGLVNGFILLGWIGNVIPTEWRSLAAVLVALVASVGAYMIHFMTGLRQPVYIHSAVAGIFLGMATAYELSGSALVIAYILEVTALVLLAKFALHSDEAASKASIVSLVPMILSLESFSRYLHAQEVFTRDFFAIVLLLGMLWLFSQILRDRNGTSETDAPKVFFAVATIASLAFVPLLMQAVFQDHDVATTITLFIYTIIGMYCYVTGKLADRSPLRHFGSVMLLLVTGHLLLIDIWNMDVVGRIITFTVIGVLFMSTAFIGKKK